MIIEVQYIDENYYEVDFDYELGNSGDYNNAPEPHEININCVYNEQGEEVEDPNILDYMEDEAYDYVSYML